MNRQKKILYVLLLVLALSSLYAYFSAPGQEQYAASRRSGSDNPGARPAQSVPRAGESNLKVELELLDGDKMQYDGYRRDIFNFYQPKPKPVPVVKAPPKPVPVSVPVERPVPVVTQEVRKQLASFTFLGFLIKDDERTVFLSKRDELFLIKKLDYFGENNQFQAANISGEMLTITQQGHSGLIEIPLIEKEPLIPSFSPGKPLSREPLPDLDVPEPPVEPEDPNRSQVPQQEQRKRWFKNAQSQGEEAVKE